MLKRQVHRLTVLVTQMLDVSRITGGGLKLVPSPVDLREVVRDVAGPLRSRGPADSTSG